MIHFVDIETSGLDPYRHEVIEVGVVSAAHGERVDELEFSLPFDESRAEPRALEINGWGRRPFAARVSVADGLDALDATFQKGDLFCAWHAHFDEAFLAELYRKNDRRAPWSHRAVVDLPSLIMGRLGVITAGSTKDLMAQLRLADDFEGRHTALVDAEANLRAYQELRLYEVAA